MWHLGKNEIGLCHQKQVVFLGLDRFYHILASEHKARAPKEQFSFDHTGDFDSELIFKTFKEQTKGIAFSVTCHLLEFSEL